MNGLGLGHRIFVYASGLAAFTPLVCSALVASGVGPVYLIIGASSSVLLGLLFALHVGRDQHMEGIHKLFWVMGLLFCFSILAVPGYWLMKIYQPYRWSRKMAAFDDDE